MKLLRNIALGLAGIIVLWVLIGLFILPSHYKVTRTLEIAAPAQKIVPLIAAPRAWKDWGVWNRRDPAMAIVYEGPESGAGAKWTWDSKSEGKGAMTITKVDKHGIEYSLYFPDFGANSSGALLLEPTGSGTRATWTNEGDLGMNPMMRWMGLFMDKLVGNDFQTGLENLRNLATHS